MEPEAFLQTLEKEFRNHYFFSDTIINEDYFRAVKKIDPNNQNVTNLNARDYALELLRKNFQKDANQSETFYKNFVYELLKTKKGRNLYITPSTIERLKETENLSGVGIILYEESIGKFFILDVMEGSPAYLAEIRPNQYLQQINGEDVDNFLIEDVVARIRGKPKTPLQLTIQGISYQLIRTDLKVIPIRKTFWKLPDKTDILYLQIRFGTRGTSEELKRILFDSPTPDIIVLDLRYLSTGDIHEIFLISDIFLPKKEIMKIYTKEKNPEVFTTKEDIFHTGKIIVLLQTKSSPFSYGLAKMIQNSPKATILGPKREIPVYIGKQIPLSPTENYGAFNFTIGYVEIPTTNEKNWIEIEDFIPIYPPSDSPTLDDPYHRKILELIKQNETRRTKK